VIDWMQMRVRSASRDVSSAD